MYNNILKQAALELEAIDSAQVVKVARIGRLLQNWWKKLTNEEYAQQLENLVNESVLVNQYISALGKNIARLQSALKDADVEDYQQALDEIKYLTKALSGELDRLGQTADAVDVVETTVNQEENKPSQDFQPKVTDIANELPIGLVNSPVENFSRYKKSSDADIVISENVIRTANPFLRNVLESAKIDSELVNKIVKDDNSAFYDELKKAIFSGTVLTNVSANQALGDKKRHTSRSANQMYVEIRTAPFKFNNIEFQAVVGILDRLTEENPSTVLSVVRINRFSAKATSTTASRKNELIKLAAQVEVRHTTISTTDFALYLMAGYKRVFGSFPTAQTLGGLWAQCLLESGRSGGNVNLRNNNFGGITAGDFDKKWNGKGWLESGKPYIVAGTGLKFKAFDSPLQGATEYVRTLANLYPESLKWKAAGLPFDDALYMSSKNYYGTIDVKSYAGPMDQLFAEFMQTIYPKLNPKPENKPAPPPGPIATEYKRFGNNPKLPDDKKNENEVVSRPELKSTQFSWLGKNKDAGESPGKSEEQLAQGDEMPDNSKDADELVNYLFAAGPLDKLVKNAIERKLLPIQNIFIHISNKSDLAAVEYAKATADVLTDCLDAETSIYKNNSNFYIKSSIAGSLSTVTDAVNAICKSVSDIFAERYDGRIVTAKIINNELKKQASVDANYSEISEEEILKYRRKFQFERLR